MTISSPTINLDKLRHTVQKFGNHSFTTSQLATDYHYGETIHTPASSHAFESVLRQHAALLGISAQPSSAAGDTVWQAV